MKTRIGVGIASIVVACFVVFGLLFVGCPGVGGIGGSVGGEANASANESVACAQVISYAESPVTGECEEFPNACTPAGWKKCEPVAIAVKPRVMENETLSETLTAGGDERVQVKNSVLEKGIAVSGNSLVNLEKSVVSGGAVNVSESGNVRLVDCVVNENVVFEASGSGKIFVVAIDFPEQGEKVSGNVTISGSAFELAGEGDLFDSFDVRYGYVAPGEVLPGRWHVIANRTTPVKDGVLAEWDTFGLMNGNYKLMVRMKDVESRVATAETIVELIGGFPA